MNKLHQRIPRVKLPFAEYQTLRKQVLGRDGWRCQLCGTPNNLQVHYVKSRSKLGSDKIQNLITLCAKCHETLHHRTHLIHDH